MLDHNIENWTNSKLIGKWTWKFDKNTPRLMFYFNRILKFSFFLADRTGDKLEWKYDDYFTKVPKSDIFHLEILKLIRLK